MSVEQQGAHEGGGHAWGVGVPPTSWPPPLFLDVGSKSPGSCSFRKPRSRKFIPFGLRLIFLFCETLK